MVWVGPAVWVGLRMRVQVYRVWRAFSLYSGFWVWGLGMLHWGRGLAFPRVESGDSSNSNNTGSYTIVHILLRVPSEISPQFGDSN